MPSLPPSSDNDSMKKLAQACVGLSLFAYSSSCSTLKGVSDLQGRMEEGAYISPLGNLEMPVDSASSPGAWIVDDFETYQGHAAGMVSFSAIFGLDTRVDYFVFDTEPEFMSAPTSEQQQSLADGLHRTAFASISAQFPGTEVLDEWTGHLGGIPAAYFVLRIPGGSTLVRANALGIPSGERLDDVRAHVAVHAEGGVYTLSTSQFGPNPQTGNEEQRRAWVEALEERWRAITLRAVE